MKPPGHTILIVTKLTVQDDLEEGLHNGWHRAVKLVKHNDAGFFTSALEPRRDDEGGYLLFIDCLHIRKTTDLSFVHGRSANVDEGQLESISETASYVRLTDTGRTAHKNRDMRWQERNNVFEGFDVHVFSRLCEEDYSIPTINYIIL